MAFNGSGVFVRLYNWVVDRDASVKIRADRMDAEMDGFATGLSTCITKDGQTTPTANIPMNSFKFTGLGAGSASTDSVRFGQIREKVTVSRTYYVRTDGSNSNTGLANTAGGAWLTLQYAYDTIRDTLDIATSITVTVQIGTGTFVGVYANGRHVGGGEIVFNGDSITPANVILTEHPNGSAGIAQSGAEITIKNLQVGSVSGHGVYAKWGGVIHHENLRFGACATGHQTVSFHGTITYADYTIVGNATYHIYAHDGAIRPTGSLAAVTLSGTPAFTTFAFATHGSFLYYGTTYTGAATGKRFVCSAGGIIEGDGNLTFLPGSTAGTCASGGAYFGSVILVAAVNAAAALTDNAVIRGDGGSNSAQTSGVTIDDSDNVVVPGTLTATGGIVATTTNDNAAATNVGYHITTASTAVHNANATVTMTIAAPCVVTWTTHGFDVGAVTTAVKFTNSGGALPTGVVSGTTYYLKAIDANTFNIATTVANALAGTFITTSGSQSGTHTGDIRISMTSGARQDVAGMSLPAGNWMVGGQMLKVAGGTTTVTYIGGNITTTTAGSDRTFGRRLSFQYGGLVLGATDFTVFDFAPVRFSLSGTTTIFLVADDSFGTSTMGCSGWLYALRPR